MTADRDQPGDRPVGLPGGGQAGPTGGGVIRQVTDDLMLVETADVRVLAAIACPHRGGRLLYGHLNPRTLRITCPLHLTSFDLITGAVVSGPSCEPLRIVSVEHRTAAGADAADRGDRTAASADPVDSADPGCRTDPAHSVDPDPARAGSRAVR